MIPNGAALRPAPPPANTTAEADEIVAIQQTVTPAEAAMIEKWNTLPTTAWHDLALDLFGFYWILLPDVRVATPARSARAFALLHVAMYDALVATWDAKYAFNRPATRSRGRASARVRADCRHPELSVRASGSGRGGAGGLDVSLPERRHGELQRARS